MGNLAAILVAVLVSDALDPCALRIESRVVPIFPMPASGLAVGVVEVGGPCSVEITYGLTRDGAASLESFDSQDRCRVFHRSAVQAFQRMKFRSGDSDLLCKYNVVYRWPPTPTPSTETSLWKVIVS